MKPTILITGASGAVGKALTQALAKENVQLRLGTRNVEKLAADMPANSEAVFLELTDDNTIRKALDGVDKVFFITPATMKAKAQQLDEIPIAKHFIDLSQQAGVKHIVRLSAMNAALYKGGLHYIIEEHLKNSSMQWTMLRPSFFMQIFDMYYQPSIKQNNVIDYYDADVKEAFIDVRDIAAVAANTLLQPKHHGKTYTLTSDELLNYKDAAIIIGKATQKNIQYTAKNDDDSRTTLTKNGWPTESVEGYIGILQAVQAGVFSQITTDVANILNRAPISFTQYAHDYKEHF